MSDGAVVLMLEKRPKLCHFVPLFGPSEWPPERRGSLGKSLQRQGIGPEVWAALRPQDRVA
jgi:hypothetical protein